MKTKITTKKKKVYALDGFVKVPKSFLVTPFFNSVRSGDSYNKVKIAKYFQYKDLEFTSESLSIFNDFDVFLFIVTETVKQKSNVIEFWFDDLADFLGIEANHKDTYFKRYCETISKLEQIHVAFFLDNVRYSLRFLELSPAQDKAKKLQLKVDQNYLNFFDSVNELYGVQRKTIKSLKSDYQRILYLMYVTNRANAENHFSVDLLKFRFQVPDTMAERKFVYNIRKANEALKTKGLIEDFSEVKKGGKTVSFKVKYTYANLHPKKEKKTDISGFENQGADEHFDDSSI
ncbi:hypothetical protein [Pseudomonas taiwanensis]|uniref:hypothetical protein n=1 Tax=Pseudomonas taiwanensis TaxID=470150 RepID=UPI0016491A49|nr:hypothetical protein [Pseudomonas taiwanensis]MBC3493072.1 hypothetical protein [Pseudomonas taiwanensis]